MKIDVQNGALRGVPVAVLLALLVQGGGAVWWVSAKARDGVFIEQRVEKLENLAEKTNAVHGEEVERLARIEERLSAQSLVLGRIEKQLSSGAR